MGPSDRHHRYLNLALVACLAGLQAVQLFVLPLWLLPRDAGWGWLLCLPVLLTTTWWSVIHEAVHGSLLAEKSWNHRLGRLNGVLFGAAFDLLRWGHLLHHALSRTRRERAEVYEPGRDRLWTFGLDYYWRLLGGLYVFEVVGSLLFLLPRRLVTSLGGRLASDRNPLGALVDKMLVPGTLAAVRQDAILSLALYAFAFTLYGQHAWMLVLALAGRALLISLMDNVWHYGTPLEQPRYARNLRLPAWARSLVLNFNLHGVHHLHPAMPWWRLGHLHRESDAGYQGELFPALLAQFRGPIAADRLP